MRSNELNVGLIEQVFLLNVSMSDLPLPWTSISGQFVSIFLTILQHIQVPLSWNADHPSKDLRLCLTAVFLFVSSKYLSMHFRACPSISYDHATVFAWGFTHPGKFSVAPAEIRDSSIFLYSSIMISFGLHSRWVHPKYTWSRNEVGSSRSTVFINFFHMGAMFCFFPVIFWYYPRVPIRTILVFDEQKRHSQFGTFSHPSPIENFLKLSFPQKTSKWMSL